MTRRVKNSLAAEWGPWGEHGLDLGPLRLFDPVRQTPTGRTIVDFKPKSLTLEMLMETKRQFEEMEVGNLPAFPDYSQIERRVAASMGITRDDLFFWRPEAQAWPIYEPPRITTHKYEEHRQKVKAMQEAQAAERTRKSYEELFV